MSQPKPCTPRENAQTPELFRYATALAWQRYGERWQRYGERWAWGL